MLDSLFFQLAKTIGKILLHLSGLQYLYIHFVSIILGLTKEFLSCLVSGDAPKVRINFGKLL